ncbi:putative phosphoribosyl transferase [Enhydrobacter aerosaccus]|uniref:Putative phosphoribosyl transferase n=1 Tax=Enhydrobacter aerosaccus TaxID=225324 RepID=A0A1T4T5Z1_9HYPH|nr:phosphoribosyltransferase [Enhydrobacter aerosaccus]SKA35866.1 putative phosphoribosyl transferase [Enhydrobacter aerosaccus]
MHRVARFKDRTDAGCLLAQALAVYRDKNPVVLALPRGGVPVAAEVAKALNAPLDLVLVRKIGAPMQPELAIGAVVDGADPIVVRNAEIISATGTTPIEFDKICVREAAEIERRHRAYLGNRPPVPLQGATAIVVDDGIATGATMMAALRAIRRRQPAKLVLAVPTAAPESLGSLRREADATVCLTAPDYFGSVGAFYEDFRQISDEEVIATMAKQPVPGSSLAPSARPS